MAGEEDKILEGARFCSLALCATTICVGQKVAVKLVCLKLGTLGQCGGWRGDAQPGAGQRVCARCWLGPCLECADPAPI